MKLVCRLLGHQWRNQTVAPDPRWNTTKEGLVLVATGSAEAPHWLDVCRRCGAQRAAHFHLPQGARREMPS